MSVEQYYQSLGVVHTEGECTICDNEKLWSAEDE